MQSRCSCCSTTLTSVLRVVILVSVHLVTGALWTHHAHVSGFLPARRYDGVVSTMAGVTPFIGKQLETEVTFRPHRYAKHKMRSIAADVAWSVCVCLLDTSVSHAKTAEPIEMPLGCGPGWSQGTMYHVGAPIPPGVLAIPPSKMHCSSESAENGYKNYTIYMPTDSVWPQQYTGVARSHIQHICIYAKKQLETTNCANRRMTLQSHDTN